MNFMSNCQALLIFYAAICLASRAVLVVVKLIGVWPNIILLSTNWTLADPNWNNMCVYIDVLTTGADELKTI
jgi:hypothetical protein